MGRERQPIGPLGDDRGSRSAWSVPDSALHPQQHRLIAALCVLQRCREQNRVAG
ncbi:hypothetical protein AB0P21_40580 [Kribbella sp. NPDC056861]|uniref:hypothetical protein n=1 Tax=Kribbella sp. NPDC056861 TaxID=3154857 RepID=UPI00343509A0